MTIAIRQTFSAISIVMFTGESISDSTAASLSEADESGIVRLSYTYTNTPKVGVRDRSIVHDGAAVFRIITESARRLEGESWTNRKSTGEMRLRYDSPKVAEVILP